MQEINKEKDNRQKTNARYVEEAKASMRGSYNYLGGYYEGAKLPTGERVPVQTEAACLGLFYACQNRLAQIETALDDAVKAKDNDTAVDLLMERINTLDLLNEIKQANIARKRTWGEYGASWVKLLSHVYHVEIKRALIQFTTVSLLACATGVALFFLVSNPLGWFVAGAIVAGYVLLKLASMVRGFYNSCVEENNRMAAEQMAKGKQLEQTYADLKGALDKAAGIELEHAQQDFELTKTELETAEKELSLAEKEVDTAESAIDVAYGSIGECKEVITTLETDILQLQQQKMQLNDSIRALMLDPSTNMANLARQNKKLETINTALNPKQKERREARTMLKTYEKALEKRDAAVTSHQSAEKGFDRAKTTLETKKEAKSLTEKHKAAPALSPISAVHNPRKLDPKTGRKVGFDGTASATDRHTSGASKRA